MYDVINLIAETYQLDAYGNQIATETTTRVYCKVNDITRAEFFASGREGLHPSYMFEVFAADYNGEKIVEFKGTRYKVYRTYRKRQDYAEVYVTEAVGITNVGA